MQCFNIWIWKSYDIKCVKMFFFKLFYTRQKRFCSHCSTPHVRTIKRFVSAEISFKRSENWHSHPILYCKRVKLDICRCFSAKHSLSDLRYLHSTTAVDIGKKSIRTNLRFFFQNQFRHSALFLFFPPPDIFKCGISSDLK